MATVCTNHGNVAIDSLPQVNGFSWWQFFELWPSRIVCIDYLQYSDAEFTNVKLYVSMLNNCVKEQIQCIYNEITHTYEKRPILFEDDTIFHLIKIVKSKLCV